MKTLNAGLQSEWHAFTRRHFGPIVVQDIDARGDGRRIHIHDDATITLATADPQTYLPTALIEIKRGTVIPVADWRPFDADRRNYAALVELARPHGIPVYVVYAEKCDEILDGTPVHAFRLTAAVPAYEYRHAVMAAAAFADLFRQQVTA